MNRDDAMLVDCSGPEATEGRMHDLLAEHDRPSRSEAREDAKLTKLERERAEACAREMRADPVWQAMFRPR